MDVKEAAPFTGAASCFLTMSFGPWTDQRAFRSAISTCMVAIVFSRAMT